jgi:hypothetical protein
VWNFNSLEGFWFLWSFGSVVGGWLVLKWGVHKKIARTFLADFLRWLCISLVTPESRANHNRGKEFRFSWATIELYLSKTGLMVALVWFRKYACVVSIRRRDDTMLTCCWAKHWTANIKNAYSRTKRLGVKPSSPYEVSMDSALIAKNNFRWLG